MLVGTEERRLAFDGSSTHRGGGVGVVLYTLDSTDISFAFTLEFVCTNNNNEYEALVIRLISALHLGFRRLRVQRDSKLIIKVNGEFTPKEINVLSYQTAVQKLVRSFESIQFNIHRGRTTGM